MFDVLSLIYEIPIPVILGGGVVCIALWAVLAYIMNKNPLNAVRWKKINCILMFVLVAGILCVTLLFRGEGIREIRLTPFYTVGLAQTYYDIYTQFALNIVMFIPFGAIFPFVLQGSTRHEIVKTVLCSILLSIFIEIMQYVFKVGYSEIDDIMSNTVGTLLGLLSYVIYKLLINRHIKKQEQMYE